MVATIKTFFLVLVLSFVALPATAVRAQEDEATTQTTQTEEADETADGESVEPSEPLTMTPEEKKSKRDARIAEYKQNVAEKLAAAKATRIAARCKAAQTKTTALKNRLNTSLTKRAAVYNEIDVKVSTLLERLKAAGIDTAGIEAVYADIETGVADVTASITDFITVLEDIEAMDCASDPDAFYAALEAARTEMKALREQIATFHSLIKTELKEALKAAREELAAATAEKKPATDTSNDGENEATEGAQ